MGSYHSEAHVNVMNSTVIRTLILRFLILKRYRLHNPVHPRKVVKTDDAIYTLMLQTRNETWVSEKLSPNQL